MEVVIENTKEGAEEQMSDQPPRLPTPEERPWNGTDLLANRPFIITLLYLATWFTGFSAIVGVVLAYVFKTGPSEEWEQTHFTYLINTFWLLLGVPILSLMIVLMVAAMLPEGIAIVVAIPLVFAALITFVLSGARTIVSMIHAVRGKPMPKPRTLLL